jgi:hypothetical protein
MRAHVRVGRRSSVSLGPVGMLVYAFGWFIMAAVVVTVWVFTVLGALAVMVTMAIFKGWQKHRATRAARPPAGR